MSQRNPVVPRLPLPPAPKSDNEDIKALHEHIQTMTTILNQGLQSLQNRVNTIQQVGATTPPSVTGVTVAGKQGLFSLAWNRIKNVDGYVVVHATDTGMTQIIGRYNIPDGNSPQHQIPVGNAQVVGNFQVYAYQGQKYSDPSPRITSTSAVFSTSTEAAPPTPPLAPLAPKISPVRSGPNL